jgi:hypothetical protein
MSTVEFNVLYDQLLPYLPGAEIELVDFQIRKVMRDFLTRTTLLREPFTFTTVPGAATYRLTPGYGEVASVMEVRSPYSVYPLPVVPEAKRAIVPTPDMPRGWWTAIAPLLVLHPVPDAEYDIHVVAAVRPTNDADRLPEDITNQHEETLATGVLAAMYSMPGKPWTKKDDALALARAYNSSVKTIRSTLRDGGQPNASTVTPAYVFGR